jgi:hypothetical protein
MGIVSFEDMLSQSTRYTTTGNSVRTWLTDIGSISSFSKDLNAKQPA